MRRLLIELPIISLTQKLWLEYPLTFRISYMPPSRAAFTLHSPLFSLFMSSYPTEHKSKIYQHSLHNRSLVGQKREQTEAHTPPSFAILPSGTNLVFALLRSMRWCKCIFSFLSFAAKTPHQLLRHERLVRLRHSLQRTRRDRQRLPQSRAQDTHRKRKDSFCIQEIWTRLKMGQQAMCFSARSTQAHDIWSIFL